MQRRNFNKKETLLVNFHSYKCKKKKIENSGWQENEESKSGGQGRKYRNRKKATEMEHGENNGKGRTRNVEIARKERAYEDKLKRKAIFLIGYSIFS